jgi:peptide/nickel transport system substrate-binding protein
MSRRTRIRLGVSLLVAGVIVGSLAFLQTAMAQETGSGDDEKVVFTWGSTGDISSLNPMVGYNATDFYPWTASYHMLIDFDENFGAEPMLATEVQVSDDNMTFTYTIRDDVVWSDGVPLTAEDVAYTMNLYKNNNAYLPQNYLTLLDGDVRVLDETHIEFDTLGPTGLYNGDAPYMYFYILPKHIFEQVEAGNCPDGADPCRPKTYENVPNIASGPFIIEEFEVGQFVRMTRNPEWTGAEPAVDELIFRIFRNEDALSQALQQGEVDFAYFTSPNIFNSLEGSENIGTEIGTIPSFSEIGMNTGSAYQEPSGDFTPHGDGHPALTDVVVRRAIRQAINSQDLVDRVLLGYGVPGNTIVPPISVEGARWEPGPDEALDWNLEAAAQSLEDAGYVDSDGDGVREMPAGSLAPGQPLEFRYHVRTNEQTSVDASPFVSEWLAQIGIQTEVIAVNSNRLTSIINAGEYDLFSWGWYPDPDPDSALAWFKCDQRPPDGTSYGNNDAYYCNPEYDALYLEQQQALNPQDRWEIVHEMQRIYYEDAAYAVMWYDSILQAYRSDRFTGFNPQPPVNGDLLEGWGGPSTVWTTLRPVGAAGEGGSSTTTRGIPPMVWAIGAGVIVLLGVILIMRRRRAADDDI